MPVKNLTSLLSFQQKVKEIKQKKIDSYNQRCSGFDLHFHTSREVYFQDMGVSKKCDWTYIRPDRKDPKTVYLIPDHYKSHINFVDNVLPTLTKKFILIIGGNDHTWPLGILDDKNKVLKDEPNIEPLLDRSHITFNHPEWYKRLDILLNSDKIIRIFVENLDMEHPKLEPYPLGMGFAQTDKYYLSILNGKIELDFNKKRKYEVLNQQNTHPIHDKNKHSWHFGQFTDRIIFGEKAQKEPLNKIVKHVPPSNKNLYCDSADLLPFKDNVLESEFIVCIHGGGLDPCPKVFEGILMGAIPIIEKSTVSPCFVKHNFPVVIVDKIDETIFTEENLDKWYDQHESVFTDKNKRREMLYKLTDTYWWDYFTSFLD